MQTMQSPLSLPLRFNFYNREICGRLEAQTAKPKTSRPFRKTLNQEKLFILTLMENATAMWNYIIEEGKELLFSPNNDT